MYGSPLLPVREYLHQLLLRHFLPVDPDRGAEGRSRGDSDRERASGRIPPAEPAKPAPKVISGHPFHCR